MKKYFRLISKPINLVWLVLLVIFGWAVRFLPLQEISATLKSLHPFNLGMLLAFNLFIVMVLCSRWWWILRLQGYRLPFLVLAAYRLVGFSISYFTPGTQFGGEPMQVYFLEKRENIPRAEAVASVALDKLFELLANFTFLAAGTLYVLSSDFFVTQIPKTWMVAWITGLLGLPVLYLLGLWVGHRPLTWLAGRLPACLKKRSVRGTIQPLVAAAEDRISVLLRQKPAGMVGIFLLSGIIWALFIAEYWLMMAILGAGPGLKDAISGLTAVRLSFLTPVPGGLGALEASQVLAAKWMGFGPALGISASLLIRGRDITLGLMGLGFGSLFSRNRLVNRAPTQVGDVS